MKRAIILSALAAMTALSVAPAAEARGRGFHRTHIHFGFAPVYPVYSYCRWYRTPYGPVKRCWY